MKASGRVVLAPGFLLHHAAWRDSSRILELFTREHGRVTLFARGVRRPNSQLRAVLQPFQRVLVSWTGRGEAGSLTAAEIDGAVTALPPGRLMSGFYLNELLVRLLARHDPHPHLFDDYASTLERLRVDAEEARPLRLFEKRLLDALGYGIDLEREARTGAELDAQSHYHYTPGRGVTLAVAESVATYSGASLVALAREQLDEGTTLADARRLLRAALDACLEGRELRSRGVMKALRAQEKRQ